MHVTVFKMDLEKSGLFLGSESETGLFIQKWLYELRHRDFSTWHVWRIMNKYGNIRQ